jgi:hypothetical protein
MQLDHLKRREFITLLGGALKFMDTQVAPSTGDQNGVAFKKKRCWED